MNMYNYCRYTIHQFPNWLTLVFSPRRGCYVGRGSAEAICAHWSSWWLSRVTPSQATTKTLIFSKKEVSKVLPLPPATSSYLQLPAAAQRGEFNHLSGHLTAAAALVPAISINTVHCSTAAQIRDHWLENMSAAPGAGCTLQMLIYNTALVSN